MLCLQRYGAKKEDQMTTVSIIAYKEKPDDLAQELGYKVMETPEKRMC